MAASFDCQSSILVSLNRLDFDDLNSLWFVFSKCREHLKNGYRLENLSWRLWYRRQHAPSQHLIASLSADHDAWCYEESQKGYHSNVTPTTTPPLSERDTEDEQKDLHNTSSSDTEDDNDSHYIIDTDEEDDFLADEDLLDDDDDDYDMADDDHCEQDALEDGNANIKMNRLNHVVKVNGRSKYKDSHQAKQMTVEQCFKKTQPQPATPRPSLLSKLLARDSIISTCHHTQYPTLRPRTFNLPNPPSTPSHGKELSESLCHIMTENRQPKKFFIHNRPCEPSDIHWLESFHGW
ncbi:uncharacterized protein BYT42DRAFT_563684 [Radiomyces spectabilis]|uniref:uncharacterized protein n=1 Tax=Radiomyces spectabilis TaxID=64574 RepID=UPI00221F6A6E|nr:uncharacterized protein BYT42DRAFT_563684 [Radiomyces spectabilis]KAI8384793.1 hypothetical protein BYT42DRAFT_563684 [Radiomyces spectabilis]